MADYNVQMKQYNGTSFDNILPYASQALTLAGGGGATEIIAQARAGLSQIATGSYGGTGTYGESNPTVIICGFKPKYVWVMPEYRTSTAFFSGSINQKIINMTGSSESTTMLFMDAMPSDIVLSCDTSYNMEIMMKVSFTNTGIKFYCYNGRNGNGANETYQMNTRGMTYRYIAFG